MSVISEIQSEIAELANKQGAAVVGIGRGWRFGSDAVIEPHRVLTAAHHRAEGHGELRRAGEAISRS